MSTSKVTRKLSSLHTRTVDRLYYIGPATSRLSKCKVNRTFVQCITLSNSPVRRSVWHVLTRDHTSLPTTHTCIQKWNEPCLSELPSRAASPHFGRYSFPVQLKVRGWVGLGGWLGTEVVLPVRRRSPISVLAGSDMRPTPSMLSQTAA